MSEGLRGGVNFTGWGFDDSPSNFRRLRRFRTLAMGNCEPHANAHVSDLTGFSSRNLILLSWHMHRKVALHDGRRLAGKESP